MDVLMRIALEVYQDFVTISQRGDKQLLVQCLNALYGTMVASLLYYCKFTNILKSHGFTMNPYDACVWNNIIDGHQATICFHVDDCKILHKSSKVLEHIIGWLRKEYKSVFKEGSGKMKIHYGKVHKFLGMTLDYTLKCRVQISMIDYV